MTKTEARTRESSSVDPYGLPTLSTIGSSEWMSRAACRGAGDIMLPERGDEAGIEVAKAVCTGELAGGAECPVRAECLLFAVENNEKTGIWGGFGEATRRKVGRFVRASDEEPIEAVRLYLSQHRGGRRNRRSAEEVFTSATLLTIESEEAKKERKDRERIRALRAKYHLPLDYDPEEGEGATDEAVEPSTPDPSSVVAA